MVTQMLNIVRLKGIGGLYAGASSYLGFAVRPALQQTIYDQLKLRVLPNGGELAFSTGAISYRFSGLFWTDFGLSSG